MRVKKRLKNSLLLAVFFIILCMSCVVCAEDLNRSITLDAQIPTGDLIKYGNPVPVTVDVMNSGGDFKGKIIVEREIGYKGEKEAFYQDVNIPHQSSKRFYLYITSPANNYYMYQMTVKLVKGRDEISKVITPRPMNAGDLLVLVMNKSKGGLSYLSGYNKIIPQSCILSVVYPDPAKLPVSWAGFKQADIIVINDLPSLGLDRQKEQAILDYVRSGGNVVFSTNLDPNEFNGSLFKDYLPIKPDSTEEISSSGNPEYSSAFSKSNVVLLKGEIRGEVLESKFSKPLVLIKREGEGSIFFITADLSKSPFQQSYEADVIWKTMFERMIGYAGFRGKVSLDNVLNDIPEIGPIPVSVILWLLFIYAIVVGPINFSYLKKKDKLMYIFITIPAIALVFSIGAFFIGYTTKGGNLIERTLNVVYLPPDGTSGVVDSISSIFSPSNAKYDIAFDSPGAVAWEKSGGQGEKLPTFCENDAFTVKNAEFKMWSVRQFRVLRPYDADKGIFISQPGKTNSQDASQSVLSWDINNRTGKTIDKCILYHGGKVSQSFILNPGMNRISTNMQTQVNNSDNLYKAILIGWGLNNVTPKTDQMIEPKLSFIRTLCDMVFMLGSQVNNQPFLICLSADDENKITLNRKGAIINNVTFYFIR